MSDLQPTRMPDGEIRQMAQQPQSPTLGRIVLFTPADPASASNGAAEYVAIIGQVFADPNSPRPYVNLLTFPPFAEPKWEGSVQESDGAETSRTWRWPPRAEAPVAHTPSATTARTGQGQSVWTSGAGVVAAILLLVSIALSACTPAELAKTQSVASAVIADGQLVCKEGPTFLSMISLSGAALLAKGATAAAVAATCALVDAVPAALPALTVAIPTPVAPPVALPTTPAVS